MKSSTTKIKRQFFDSLKRGTGETYLIQSENPNIDFSEFIIKGGTTNYALDQQSEGSRAFYILGLIKKSKQRGKIIKAILTKLKVEKKDYWGLEQMCDLAVLFDKEGIPEAKKALYVRFNKNHLKGYEFCGQSQIIEIDGLKGLLTVAEVVGKQIYKNKDGWEDSWCVDEFQKRNKHIDIYHELEKAGKKNKYIKTYLESVIENKRKKGKKIKFKKFTYDTIKEKINLNKFRIINEERANDLSAIEVKQLADEFLTEKDESKKEQYLRFFSCRKFPYNFKSLLDIGKRKQRKGTRIKEFALGSLKYFKDKRIRHLALTKFKEIKNPCDYLNLLVSNYKSGDNKVLTEILYRSNDYDFIHSLVPGLIEIYQSNPTNECRGPMETIYLKMNCGLHRSDVVEILKNNNVLSDKIFNEMKFDSNDSVRKSYREWKKRLPIE